MGLYININWPATGGLAPPQAPPPKAGGAPPGGVLQAAMPVHMPMAEGAAKASPPPGFGHPPPKAEGAPPGPGRRDGFESWVAPPPEDQPLKAGTQAYNLWRGRFRRSVEGARPDPKNVIPISMVARYNGGI